MKRSNAPRHLTNTPKDYSLDVADKRAISKYRRDKERKQRELKQRVESVLSRYYGILTQSAIEDITEKICK